MGDIRGLIGSCRKINGLIIEAVEITPLVAQKMLEFNIHNRKISPTVVSKYSQEILNDEWVLSAQGIGFDSNGVLSDGQHRLSAIIQSGKTTSMLVVYGLPTKSQEKVDRQKKRSLYDVFNLAGYSKNQKEVQISTFIAILNAGSREKGNSIPDSVVRETMLTHKQAILSVLEGSEKNDRGTGRVGFLAACVFYYEMYGDRALKFIKNVRRGEMLSLDDPAMRLRRYLLGESGYVKLSTVQRGGSQQIVDYRKTIYCINADIMDKKICSVKESTEIVTL